MYRLLLPLFALVGSVAHQVDAPPFAGPDRVVAVSMFADSTEERGGATLPSTDLGSQTGMAVQDSVPVRITFGDWRTWSGGTYRNCGTKIVGVHDDPRGRVVGSSSGYSYNYSVYTHNADEFIPDSVGLRVSNILSSSSASSPGRWPNCGAIAARARAGWSGRGPFWAVYSLPEEQPIAKFYWTVEGLTVHLDGTESRVATVEGPRPVASYTWSVGGGGAVTQYTFDEPGDYEVSLTVTDDEGDEDTYTEIVTVSAHQLTVRSLPVEPGRRYGRGETIVIETTVENTGTEAVQNLVVPAYTEVLAKAPDMPPGADRTDDATARRITDREPVTQAVLDVGETVVVQDSFRVEDLARYRLDGVWRDADAEAWAVLFGAVQAEPTVGETPVQVLRPCDEGDGDEEDGCETFLIGPARFIVTTDGDESDPDLSDDLCDVDTSTEDLECTLRAAIENVNAGSEQPIAFEIEGTGPHTIALTRPLPTVAAPTDIDGTSQPGYSGYPLIVLDGSGAGSDADGLTLTASTTVRGLSVVDFEGAGVRLTGDGGHTVRECYLGVAPNGTSLRANRYGVLVDDTPSNTIGGVTAATRNLIGVRPEASENVREATAGVLVRGSASGTVVAGNWIGLRGDGGGPLDYGRRGIGVLVIGGAGTVIGGAAGTPGTAPGNVIGGLAYGVAVTSGAAEDQAVGIRIDGNLVGTNATGDGAVRNRIGIGVLGQTDGVEIGTGAGNVISGYETAGISVTNVIDGATGEASPGPARTRIVGNTIGLTLDGQSLLGEGLVGIAITGLPGSDGAPTPGPISTQVGASGAAANVIAGNGAQVFVRSGAHPVYSDPEATDEEVLQTYTFVENNRLGLFADGTAAGVPSTTEPINVAGVLVTGAARARVGVSGAPNVIGSQSAGVLIEGAGSSVAANRIGTDPTGLEARPNRVGVAVTGRFVVIGSATADAAESNLISGNDEAGILVNPDIEIPNPDVFSQPIARRAAPDSTESARPASGIFDLGTEAAAAELPDVAGVLGNRIGLAADGTALPNGAGYDGSNPRFDVGAGILVENAESVIAGNTVSGNVGDGVSAFGNEGTAIVWLLGNVIGGTDDETVAAPNTRDGVHVRGARVTVGVPVEAQGTIPPIGADVPNRIWTNGRHGVGSVFAADDLFVREASFHGNGGLGIATGLNGVGTRLAPPTSLLPSVDASGSVPTLRFRANAPDVSMADIDALMAIGFYLSDTCDPSGSGEGLLRVDERIVDPDETFDVEWTSDGGELAAGRYLTMTSTQGWADGSQERYQTSPFSLCARLVEAADLTEGPVAAAGDVLAGRGLDVRVQTLGGSGFAATGGGSGLLQIARYDLAPDSSGVGGSAPAPDGSTVAPDSVAARYWALGAEHLDGATYRACLDADGLFPDVSPASLVIVQRERPGAPWSPVPTTQRAGDGRLCALGLVGFGHLGVGATTGRATSGESTAPPAALALGAPYPNPARSRSATIRVELPAASGARLEVYDALGRRVATPHDGPLAAGRHDLPIAVGGLPSGVYLVRLTAGTGSVVRQLTVAR